MGHTAVSATKASSVTLQILQHGAKKKNCNFKALNRVVDKKTSIIKTGPNVLNFGYKMNRPPIVFFLFLSKPSLISKDQKENIICTIAVVRGDFLGPPHGTTVAAVIANKILL